MKVQVRLFARAREVVGARQLELEVDGGATPARVFDVLCERTPALASMRRLLRCAVNQEYADWDSPIGEGMEVAFIPPTAGG